MPDEPVTEARRIPKAILFSVNGTLIAVAVAILFNVWVGSYGAHQ
jgi:hypothetical protein